TTPPQQGQGCTPGYWKNHPASWPPTGYSTSQSVSSVFSEATRFPARGSSTLLQALSFQGGSDLDRPAQTLLPAGASALFNPARRPAGPHPAPHAGGASPAHPPPGGRPPQPQGTPPPPPRPQKHPGLPPQLPPPRPAPPAPRRTRAPRSHGERSFLGLHSFLM